MEVTITPLDDKGDDRGRSFSIPWTRFLATVAEMHIAEIAPGKSRGNHRHDGHREVLVILFSDRWTLRWAGESGRQERSFEGGGCVALEIERGVAHALRNDGKASMCIASLADAAFDAANPDVTRVQLT